MAQPVTSRRRMPSPRVEPKVATGHTTAEGFPRLRGFGDPDASRIYKTALLNSQDRYVEDGFTATYDNTHVPGPGPRGRVTITTNRAGEIRGVTVLRKGSSLQSADGAMTERQAKTFITQVLATFV